MSKVWSQDKYSYKIHLPKPKMEMKLLKEKTLLKSNKI